MDKIRDNLFIGDKYDLNNYALSKNNITAILNVSIETKSYEDNSIKTIKIGMKDEALDAKRNTNEAVIKLAELLNDGETVLVHCSYGKSRSPHIIASYLSIKENKDYFDVYEEIRRIRPKVMQYSIGQEILDRLL